jgi:HSP20 family protein
MVGKTIINQIYRKEEMKMAFTPWRERQPLSILREEIDNIFDRFFRYGKGFEMEPRAGTDSWSPAVDLEETDDKLIVKAEMPGLEPEDFQVSLYDNKLAIKGEKRQQKEEKKKDYRMVERNYGSFYRSIPLPYPVESDKAEAYYDKGVLEITLPKPGTTRAKQIEVNVK